MDRDERGSHQEPYRGMICLYVEEHRRQVLPRTHDTLNQAYEFVLLTDIWTPNRNPIFSERSMI